MMKIKILALTAFMLCLVMILASCGAEEPTEGTDPQASACTEIVDADNDGKCDNCGHICTVDEEEIPVMEVKPVPDESYAKDYFAFTYEGADIPLSKYDVLTGGLIENSAINGGRIIVLWYKQPVSLPGTPEEQMEYQNRYTVYDLDENKAIYSVVSEKYIDGSTPKDSYTFTCSDYYVSVRKSLATLTPLGQEVIENTWVFLTNAGDSITSTKTLTRLEGETVGDVYYITVNDLIFPIDINTHKRVTLADGTIEGISTNADIFVKRPAFDYTRENYGYVFERNDEANIVGLQVYDLNKWLECIYSYDVASYASEADTFMGVLQNGNVLMQTLVPLHKNAKAYDVIENGDKFDMVYTIINPFENTLTEVEFGYFIEGVFEASASGIIVDEVKAPNVAYVYSVVDDHIDRSDLRTFVVDNNLNILCEHKEILPAQYGADKIAVGNGLYIVNLFVGDRFVEAIVDEEDNFVEYLPENYFAGDGFIIAGKHIYGYDMKELFNLASIDGEYTIEHCSRRFLILSRPSFSDNGKRDFYYYAPNTTASPVEIASERSGSRKSFVGMLGSGLFVVSEATMSVDGTMTTYQYFIYNSENTVVRPLDKIPTFVGEYDDAILVYDGSQYYVFYK